jgi:diguanylate cyclase
LSHNSFPFFQEKMNRIIQYRLMLESDLRSALGGPNLFLHYQPQLDAARGHVLGDAAIVRAPLQMAHIHDLII